MNTKEDTKRSILTEEEETGAARMAIMGFSVEQICYRIQYLRKREIGWAIGSIIKDRKGEGGQKA